MSPGRTLRYACCVLCPLSSVPTLCPELSLLLALLLALPAALLPPLPPPHSGPGGAGAHHGHTLTLSPSPLTVTSHASRPPRPAHCTSAGVPPGLRLRGRSTAATLCTALHYTAHCTALYQTALHCTALNWTALHTAPKHWTALYGVRRPAEPGSINSEAGRPRPGYYHTLPCPALHYHTLPYHALHYTTTHCP